jgi:hypothetical protein
MSSAGEWLLKAAKALLGKKLHVRIRGTCKDSFHRGRYEDKGGSIKLEAIPASLDASVSVKIGWAESNRPFHVRYLHPETTLDGDDPSAQPLSIRSNVGQEVVVIGPDLDENLDFVGQSGTVITPPFGYGLSETDTVILIGGYGRFFPTSSICRSGPFPLPKRMSYIPA